MFVVGTEIRHTRCGQQGNRSQPFSPLRFFVEKAVWLATASGCLTFRTQLSISIWKP